eukprot:345193-Rhodomonas_salina.1
MTAKKIQEKQKGKKRRKKEEGRGPVMLWRGVEARRAGIGACLVPAYPISTVAPYAVPVPAYPSSVL